MTIAVQTLNKDKVKVIDLILAEELKKLTKKIKLEIVELFPIVTKIFSRKLVLGAYRIVILAETLEYVLTIFYPYLPPIGTFDYYP